MAMDASPPRPDASTMRPVGTGPVGVGAGVGAVSTGVGGGKDIDPLRGWRRPRGEDVLNDGPVEVPRQDRYGDESHDGAILGINLRCSSMIWAFLMVAVIEEASVLLLRSSSPRMP